MRVRNLGQVGCAAVVVNLRSVLENGVILICETTSFNYLPRLFFFSKVESISESENECLVIKVLSSEYRAMCDSEGHENK